MSRWSLPLAGVLLSCTLDGPPSIAEEEGRVAPAAAPISALAMDAARLYVASDRGVEVIGWPQLETREHIAVPAPKINALLCRGGRLWAAGGWSDAAGWMGGRAAGGANWEEHPHAAASPDAIYALAIDPSGDRIAWASLDGTVRVSGTATERAPQILGGHSDGVTAVAWLDEEHLVTGSLDHTIRLWDATSGTLLRTLDNHTAAVQAMATRPSGGQDERLPQLASIGDDRTIRVWQPTIGRLVRFARLEKGRPTCLCWSGDGARLWVGTTLGDLLEINPNTAAVRSSRRLAADWLTAVVLAPDGSVIAGAADGKLYPSDPLVK